MKSDNQSAFIKSSRHSHKRKSEDIDSLGFIGRSNTTNTVHLEPHSQQEMRKMINSLQKSLMQSKQQHQELQQKLAMHIKRSFEREQQFHRIIDGFISTKYSQQGESSEIKRLHQQLLGNLQQNDDRLRQKYEFFYQQNLKIMQRKISHIMHRMQSELKNTQKMTDTQSSQIKGLISRLESTALQIDKKNVELTKINSELELKLKLINEEKKLLIEEINQKKILAKKYYQMWKDGQDVKVSKDLAMGKTNSIDSKGKRLLRQKNNHQQRAIQTHKTIAFMQSKSNNYLIQDSGNIASYNSIVYHPQTNPHHQSAHISPTKGDPTQNKIFSHEFVTHQNIILMDRPAMKSHNNRNKKKQYISSMSITRANSPQRENKFTTATKSSRNDMKSVNINYNNVKSTQNSVFVLPSHQKAKKQHTKTNKSIKAVQLIDQQVTITQPPHQDNNNNNNKQVTIQQFNTINSIRNIASRQRQKKLQYQGKLTQLQRKILAIDKIITSTLLMFHEIQDERSQRAQREEGKCESRASDAWSESGELVLVVRTVLDKMKSVIDGNADHVQSTITSHSPELSNLNQINSINFNKGNNNQLLSLLEAELNQLN